MANNREGVTTTGLKEFEKAIELLPISVKEAGRRVALRTALRVNDSAKRILRSQQKTEAHALADRIHIVDDAEAHNQYIVRSDPPEGQDPKVTIYNEFGTSAMEARPYMRPSLDAEREQYRKDLERESLKAAEEALT